MLRKLAKLCVALVAVLFLVLGGMWITGGGDGRLQEKVELTFRRPGVEIFPWLVEPELLQRWLTGLREITPLTEGGPRLGARSRDVLVERGERFVLETLITEYDPPTLLAVQITGDSFVSEARYELLDRGPQTLLRYSSDTRFEGFFFKLMEPVIGLMARHRVNQDLRTLRSLVESAPANPEQEEPEPAGPPAT